MSQLDWRRRLNQIRTMKPRETAYRIREKVSIARERFGIGPARPRAPRSFKEYLVRARGRFYAGASQASVDFARTHFPEWIERAAGRAIELPNFGPVNFGVPIDWHRDPATGQTWERRFWADYDLENDARGRDSKIVHELNRHQHLPRLAKAFALTGDERFAAQAIAQLESWIGQNPVGYGIHWHSSLEIAIRAISWLWTLFFTAASSSLDEAAAQRIGDSLFAQLGHVHRHLSTYSSPNTHLIGEAAALFIAGIVFWDCECGAAWLGRGAQILMEEAEKQILEDGVYGERSTYYHCYALDLYLQAWILAQRNGLDRLAPAPDKLARMIEFLMHVTRPDGTLPLLGDDDGGRALALNQRTYRSFQDAMSTGAALFRRGDFKHQAAGFSEETYWLLGEDGWREFDALDAEEPRETRLYCPHGGYAIQRSGWGGFDAHLIFDFGGLGMFNGGHAHAGCLSTSLFSGGHECLIDPGTFVYNGAPQWRKYFRSTRAHNTVVIDGRDQAEATGTFRWETNIPTRAVRKCDGPVEYIEAEHEGYAPVIHRRRLFYGGAGYWIVADDFRGPGSHAFEFVFQLGPEFLPILHASPEADVTAGRGWRSRGYGHKEPIRTLHAKCSGTPESVRAMTLLIPEPCNATVERLETESEDAIACSIEHGIYRDIAVCSASNREIQVEKFRLRGEFFWLRLERGNVKFSFASGEGQLVEEVGACAPFAAS